MYRNNGAAARHDDDPERQLLAAGSLEHSVHSSLPSQRLKSAGDRVSCDSGISLEEPPLVASPGVVRRRTAKLGPTAGAGSAGSVSGRSSYVRRLTQLFENLSHDEPPLKQQPHGHVAGTSYHNQHHSHHPSSSSSSLLVHPVSAMSTVAAATAVHETPVFRSANGALYQVAEESPPEVSEGPLQRAVPCQVLMEQSGTTTSEAMVERVIEASEVPDSSRRPPAEAGGKKRLSRRRTQLPKAAIAIEVHDKISEGFDDYDYDDDEFDTSDDEEDDDPAAQGRRPSGGGGGDDDDEFGEESSIPLDDRPVVSEAHNALVPEHPKASPPGAVHGRPYYDEEDDFSSSSFDSDSDEALTSYVARPDSNSSLKTSRVTNILQELLDNEANYVHTLGRGIANYVSIMTAKELPPGLRGQRYHIFGNIEKIHSLHQNQFLPMLQSNRASIQGIAETFIRFLERDKFYCYIMFALNRPKSERICNRNLDFFQRRQTDVDDKLGLNSFLLQPIQRLPRYKLLLAEINKEILKQMEDTLLESVKDEIGILCKAEKRLERFIDVVNEAMSINDIQECYEVNLFHQGKFRKMFEVDVYDWDHRRRYPAKMFLFERSLIYTEKCKAHLEYRGRYDESEIGLYNENRTKVYLFSRKRGIQEIEVTCGDMNEAQRLASLVERMMTQFAQYERERINSLTARRDLHVRVPSVITLKNHRHSELSTTSTINSARESYESTSQTTWSTDKPIAQLANMQKHFCQILTANRRYYFHELPDELSGRITEFIRVYDRLLNVHIKRLYADLSKPHLGVDEVCELFIGYFKDGAFDDYNEYMRLFKPAAEVLKNIHKARRSSITDSMVAPTMDEFTFLCVQHWNKVQHFFQALVVQLAEQMNGGNMTHQDLFRKLAYVEVQVASFRQLLFQNYRLFNLDEKLSPDKLGLVVYSDRVRYDNETIGSHRVLLCGRSVVCVKFHFVREFGRQTEKYTGFAFIDRFGRNGADPNVRLSKKSEVRLNVQLVGTKHAIDFGNTANRDKFYGQYCATFARHQERGL
ncbi:uncharacterized protein LOC131211382 isoform X2 [Anopheles bellator]|uniref:uncharacterized protein LOC131211382 isoform X2 n=1 Tax=Anopheles bellator TaxID=139047 RepID=UPI002647BFC0|nr:uncharacterized protein LOC131211382 isoform X2 [Anopheles bellator]